MRKRRIRDNARKPRSLLACVRFSQNSACRRNRPSGPFTYFLQSRNRPVTPQKYGIAVTPRRLPMNPLSVWPSEEMPKSPRALEIDQLVFFIRTSDLPHARHSDHLRRLAGLLHGDISGRRASDIHVSCSGVIGAQAEWAVRLLLSGLMHAQALPRREGPGLLSRRGACTRLSLRRPCAPPRQCAAGCRSNRRP